MAKTSKNKKTEKDRKLQNEKSKECMRKLREKRKSDPILYEEQKRIERERYKARKEAGKIKLINDFNDREKRKIRKEWRKRSKKSYNARKNRQKMEMALQQETPPDSPVFQEPYVNPQPRSSRQSIMGKQIQRRNRNKMKKQIENLKAKLEESKRKIEKYKKRLTRKEEKKDNTPNKKVKQMPKGQQVTPEVKRSLLFGEVIQEQLHSNFIEQKRIQDKKRFVKCISGNIINKYKFKGTLGHISSKRIMQSGCNSNVLRKKDEIAGIRTIIQNFFEDDKISRMCPGKKDTITFRKNKKQKRYLNDSIMNIYKVFQTTHPQIKISYSNFCKFRPFWVIFPHARLRETCLCILHDNMTLLTSKLKILHVIKAATPTDILKEICCDSSNESCLDRVCTLCKDKEIEVLEFDERDLAEYEKWQSKKVELIIKGEKKMCQKTVKEKIECTKGEIIQQLKEAIPKFVIHTKNIIHQYHSIIL